MPENDTVGLDVVLASLSKDLKAAEKSAREQGGYGLGVARVDVELAVTVERSAEGTAKLMAFFGWGGAAAQLRAKRSNKDMNTIRVRLAPTPEAQGQPPEETGQLPESEPSPSASPFWTRTRFGPTMPAAAPGARTRSLVLRAVADLEEEQPVGTVGPMVAEGPGGQLFPLPDPISDQVVQLLTDLEDGCGVVVHAPQIGTVALPDPLAEQVRQALGQLGLSD